MVFKKNGADRLVLGPDYPGGWRPIEAKKPGALRGVSGTVSGSCEPIPAWGSLLTIP